MLTLKEMSESESSDYYDYYDYIEQNSFLHLTWRGWKTLAEDTDGTVLDDNISKHRYVEHSDD